MERLLVLYEMRKLTEKGNLNPDPNPHQRNFPALTIGEGQVHIGQTQKSR